MLQLITIIVAIWLTKNAHACFPHSRSRRQTNGCFFSAGTYGGGGGNAFNELLDNCGAVIKRITIRAWSYIDAIQITYRLSNGQDYTAGFHGGYGGARHVIDIDITNEEKIIGIFGRSASYVDRLGFITNKGRIFGPYGGCGGRSFNVDSCHIRGIYGRSASYLDSIGFFCSHI